MRCESSPETIARQTGRVRIKFSGEAEATREQTLPADRRVHEHKDLKLQSR